MIYAYGNIYRSKHQFAYDESDYELSKIMTDYWANFIKKGNPNGDGLPVWNNYNDVDCNIMELGSKISSFKDTYIEAYKIIEKYIDKNLA